MWSNYKMLEMKQDFFRSYSFWMISCCHSAAQDKTNPPPAADCLRALWKSKSPITLATSSSSSGTQGTASEKWQLSQSQTHPHTGLKTSAREAKQTLFSWTTPTPSTGHSLNGYYWSLTITASIISLRAPSLSLLSIIQGKNFSTRKVIPSVPQGSTSGPTVFCISVNDLCNNIKAKARPSADDTIF